MMSAASFEVSDFGVTKYGEQSKKYTLRGAGGVVLEVSDYGGKVVRLFTADRDGGMKDVVVGFDSPPAGTTATPTGVRSSAVSATASPGASFR
jgi:galactose mutarotase-like enzyme